MQVDLVQTTTSDEITLDGMFVAARGQAPSGRAVDAMLLIHGSGGSFYGGLLAYLAEQFSGAGYPVASFNNTGHGLAWRSADHDKFYGNAFEVLDRCRIDLDAGVSWLAQQGYQRIAIFGHSLGAVKVVYYQAHVQDPRVATVISSSPVRLSHSYYVQSEGAEEYREHYEKAKALVDSGQPDALFQTTFPIPHLWSAAAYIDKHASEQYNMVNYGKDVKCPLLLMAGTLETHPRLLDCVKDTYDNLSDKSNAKLIIAEGADHGWAGMRDVLANYVLEWVGQLEPARVATPGNG